MMSNDNKVTLKVGGMKYDGWTDVQITLSIKSLAGSFSIGFTERWPGQKTVWPIKAGAHCEVAIGQETVITGYVDVVDASYDANSHTLVISGRDVAGDLIDCTVDPKTYVSQSYEQILTSLAKPFGIHVIAKKDLSTVVPRLVLDPGETVFSVMDRVARAAGVCLMSSGTGDIFLSTSDCATQALDSLVLGKNIVKASSRTDFTQLYSQVVVSSQISGESLDKYDVLATQPKAELKRSDTAAMDSDLLNRYRPLRVIAESQLDSNGCKQRAQWEVSHREAEAFELSVVVQGWRQSNGSLWKPNMLVKVEDEHLRINKTLLITEVTYSLSSAGTTATLLLQPKEAFEPCPEIPKLSNTSDKYQVI